MSSISEFSFGSALANGSGMDDVNYDVGLLTPGDFINAFHDVEVAMASVADKESASKETVTDVEGNAGEKAMNGNHPVVERVMSIAKQPATNLESTEADEFDVDDGMDEFLLQIIDRQTEEEEEKRKKNNKIIAAGEKKINIIQNKQIRPAHQQTAPKLKKLLETPRCNMTKNSKKFYNAKRKSATVIITEEPERKIAKKMTELPVTQFAVPSSIYPRVIVKNVKAVTDSNGSQKSVSPVQTQTSTLSQPSQQPESSHHSKASEELEPSQELDSPKQTISVKEVPAWVGESNFTASQKEAVIKIYDVGNTLSAEVVALERESEQLRVSAEKQRKIIEKQQNILSDINEKQEWMLKNITLKKKKLTLLSNINFM